MLDSLVGFILAILILVTVHEWAHFIVARLLDVKVIRFSVGFGKPFWVKQGRKDNTEFCLAPIPLGGYVKMLDSRDESVSKHERHRAFDLRPPSHRFAIVAAGPIINLVLAALLFTFINLLEKQSLKPIIGSVDTQKTVELQPNDQLTNINNADIHHWGDAHAQLSAAALKQQPLNIALLRSGSSLTVTLQPNWDSLPEIEHLSWLNLGITPFTPPLPPMISAVTPGSAAEKAQLKSGDLITHVDNQSIGNWAVLVDLIQHSANQTLTFTIVREGQSLNADIKPLPKVLDSSIVGFIGAQANFSPADISPYLQTHSHPLPSAIASGINQTLSTAQLILISIGKMITGQLSLNNLSGPITIAQIAGETLNHGTISFLNFLAFISISLGVLNLLPIPLLDGGHLVLYAIEWMKGSPLSLRLQMILQRLGMTILALLTLIAIFNDLLRL